MFLKAVLPDDIESYQRGNIAIVRKIMIPGKDVNFRLDSSAKQPI